MIKKTQVHLAGRCFGPAITSFRSALALLLCAAATLTARAGADSRVPELPLVCEKIAAPEGNKVAFRVYAVGVQIYR